MQEEVYKVVDKWLAIKDKQAIDIIFEVATHAVMPGDPLWLLVTAASGSAKTELLRSFRGAKYNGKDLVYMTDSLTKHTLVSGLLTSTGKDPSQLAEMNDKLVIVKDFSHILSLTWSDQVQVFADLR